ncbi:hypothetical protein KJ766_00835 [Patescibacteria group bacterium]|nr:hypothetical protein [Patescibacteria group bacterium]
MATDDKKKIELGEKKSSGVDVENQEQGLENRIETNIAPDLSTENTENVAQEVLENVEQIAKPAPVPKDQLPQKAQLTRDIEEILSEDLTEIYLSMPADRQQSFRIKGEEVALQIKVMIENGKVEVNKILGLLLAWLGMIPGINKFFLQQEAKIKTDKIIERYELELNSKSI